MVKQRNLFMCVILSFLTCGIYSLFWLAGIINDICILKGQKLTGGRDILFTILTCGVYGLFVYYRIGNDLDDLKRYRGLNSGNNAILYLVLGVFGLGFISYMLAQHSLNELC